MADDKIAFELVSPEKLLVSRDVDMVVVPGREGDFGVLPGHALFMSEVRIGVIDIYAGSTVDARIFVAGGFAEVTPERCTVLAEEAVPVADIDKGAVDQRVSDAEFALKEAQSDSERDTAQSQLDIAKAMQQLAGQ